MKKTVQDSENSWDGKWPRYDPRRGYLLCEPCWNQLHFSPAYFDSKTGIHYPRTANCDKGLCHCGCRPEFRAKTPKFTGEGQTKIDTGSDVLVIEKESSLNYVREKD